MKKILFVVLDGLGDLPSESLGGRSPLEAANTPNLDLLARKGRTGLMYPVDRTIAPESDIAVISILGYPPDKYYTGRGPLECFAEGLEVREGDLAYRVNFACLGEDGRIIDRRVGRNLTTQEANLLSREINSKVKLSEANFEFKNTIGHRGVLLIKAKKGKLSGMVTNTDPAYEKRGHFGLAKKEFRPYLLNCEPLAGCEDLLQAQHAAELTNEFIKKAREVLKDSPVNKRRQSEGKLPANVILTRDAGDRLPRFPKFSKRFRLNFASFVQMPVEKGIALLLGMDVITVSKDVNYAQLASFAQGNLSKFDGLYIHIKGPDEPAHDGDCAKKKEVIEVIDREFFQNLLHEIDLNETVIAVTADHSTPCSLKAHSSDPVPLLIAGASIKEDGVDNFSESSCRRGEIGSIKGYELMKLLVGLAGQ